MALLGILSKERLHVRIGLANGSGWGCVVHHPEKTWCIAAFRGGGGAAAVHGPADDWTLFSRRRVESRGEEQMRGDAVVATLTSPSEQPHLMQAASWVFAYEGTIEDMDALRAALDPEWVPRIALRTPGDVVCIYLLTYLAGLGAQSSDENALRDATKRLERAGRLGSAAFLCSDGEVLYAYSIGLPLVLSNLADAIVVSAPELASVGAGGQSVSNATLLSLARIPQLGWSMAQAKDE
jgi:hypothetical protein